MSESVLFDKKFLSDFEEISSKMMSELVENLCGLFDTSEFHFCRSTMSRFYFKYPKVKFDREVASDILSKIFDGGKFSIINLDKIPSRNYIAYTFPTEENARSGGNISDENWSNFHREIQEKYWDEKKDHTLPKLNFFELREAKTLREKALVDGIDPTYKFFNVREVLQYYENLIAIFFPEYVFMKDSSNKKIKRYGKDIGNGLCVGFIINYSFLEGELKNGYLELPDITIEIFSKDVNRFIPEIEYLKGDEVKPIGRVALCYFMGHIVNKRLGSSSETEEILYKKLYFAFNVRSFYTRIYLEQLERVLSAI